MQLGKCLVLFIGFIIVRTTYAARLLVAPTGTPRTMMKPMKRTRHFPSCLLS